MQAIVLQPESDFRIHLSDEVAASLDGGTVGEMADDILRHPVRRLENVERPRSAQIFQEGETI